MGVQVRGDFKHPPKNMLGAREGFPPKKTEFYEKGANGGVGGLDQPYFISLIQNYTYVLRNTVKILNKGFLKAVRGGGGTVL